MPRLVAMKVDLALSVSFSSVNSSFFISTLLSKSPTQYSRMVMSRLSMLSQKQKREFQWQISMVRLSILPEPTWMNCWMARGLQGETYYFGWPTAVSLNWTNNESTQSHFSLTSSQRLSVPSFLDILKKVTSSLVSENLTASEALEKAMRKRDSAYCFLSWKKRRQYLLARSTISLSCLGVSSNPSMARSMVLTKERQGVRVCTKYWIYSLQKSTSSLGASLSDWDPSQLDMPMLQWICGSNNRSSSIKSSASNSTEDLSRVCTSLEMQLKQTISSVQWLRGSFPGWNCRTEGSRYI